MRLEVGQFIAAIDYVKAQRLRRQMRDSMIAALEGCACSGHCPLCRCAIPTQGMTMIEFAGRKMPLPAAVTRFSGPFNSAGLPAVSIPVGKDDKGLAGVAAARRSAGRGCHCVGGGPVG